MQAADLIQKILVERGLSQTALSETIDIDRTLINNYVSGKRDPGPLTCVLLAALSDHEADRSFWIKLSGLTKRQIELLGAALGAPSPTVQAGDEEALLAWWREPGNPTEGYVRDLVKKLLALRATE